MSENQTKKGRCSSWLTEAANYGAEPIEPVKPVGKKSQIRSESSQMINNQSITIMCGLYYPHPSNTIFISKGRKDDEEEAKAYEDEEDKL